MCWAEVPARQGVSTPVRVPLEEGDRVWQWGQKPEETCSRTPRSWGSAVPVISQSSICPEVLASSPLALGSDPWHPNVTD
jgi:hypothetical protein